jgi:hypothetical protein
MSAVRASLVVLIFVSAACAGDAPASSSVEVIDSAGVRIVVNAAPDTAGPIFRLSAQPIASIGVTEGAPEYQLYRASGGRRLSDGTIVFANGGTQEVRFYDAQGTHIRSVGREGEGPGEFMSLSLAGVFADDSILVGDSRLRRYSVMDRAGAFVRSFPIPDTFPSFPPTTVGVLPDGSQVVTTAGNVPTGPEDLASLKGLVRRPDVVYTISPDGATVTRIGEAPGGEVFFLGGAMGPSSMGVIFGRNAYATAAGDRVVIATNDEYSLPVYDTRGQLLHVVRQTRAPVPVQPGDFERALPPFLKPDAPSTPMKERFAPGLADMPKHTTLPAFGAPVGPTLKLDSEGSLWVGEYEAVLGDMPGTWQAFDSEGVFLGRLELPEGFVVFEFGRDWILGRLPDEMEVERVLLYGLERVTAPQ